MRGPSLASGAESAADSVLTFSSADHALRLQSASMDMDALTALDTQVLLWAFLVSLGFGGLIQRTHFCTMGAISDIVHMGDWSRMRMWASAVGVAMWGFFGMAAAGWIDPMATIYASGHVLWLSSLTGGLLFGFGMVLASGCGSKNLARLGAGSLKALVVTVVMGLSALATLRGITAVLRHDTVDRMVLEVPGGASLPAWLSQQMGWDMGPTGLWLGGGMGLLLLVWSFASADFRRQPSAWIGGLGVGACIALLWWVSGHLGFVPEHPETLEPTYLGTASRHMESLTFTAPIGYALDWLMYFSDRSQHLSLGVVSVAGVVAGAAVSALVQGHFRWEGFRDTRDTALHLAGAVCMGVGGVTAMGCTVGQGLTGLSTLALGSLIAVLGIVLGALAGFRFQEWLIDRE